MKTTVPLVLLLAAFLFPCASGADDSTLANGNSSAEEPAASSSKPVKPTRDADPKALVGYGATIQAWETQHGESVKGFSEGSVYGPVVRDGAHKYVGVRADDRVTFYSRTFPDGTSLEDAKRLVLQDFPEQASISVEDTDEPSCVIVLIDSKKVRRVTGSNATAAFFSEQGPSDDLSTR